MNTADQYVKAIYLLQEMENGPASTGALADRLGVSPASANEMIGKLESRGLAEHEKYKGGTQAVDGIVRARGPLQPDCIIGRFLANVLSVDEFRAEAGDLEPVIDDLVAERLDTIIDRNAECPDCFDPETDACCHLDVPAEPVETEEQRAD
jgi:Mn-dependent DtxR family transcriptional regulator